MALLVVQHPVRDYAAWRKVYEEVSSINSMDQAVAFMSNPEVEAAMKRAGVAGPPRAEFYEEA
jgi:hypothetical protein